jgi:hypothetical protein
MRKTTMSTLTMDVATLATSLADAVLVDFLLKAVRQPLA